MEDDSERDRAFKVAYTQGRRDADVDSHLRSHENRLNAVNGSIVENARIVAQLQDSIQTTGDSLEKKIDAIAATLVTRDAVEADRNRQLKEANEKQISRRTFWLGVVAICVTALIGILAKSHGVP
jgi:uncharacterized protein (DUF885 family)